MTGDSPGQWYRLKIGMKLCGSALGLSPYARTRIQQPDQADDDDPLALLLGENGRAWRTEASQNSFIASGA